ncbi:TRAP transporter small permease [Metabacillus arenae]|uniref:TRAP transporter small permease n=1 Tax=Metabacillus arenae TaxID=2771434 RepID=A0A926N957_9BACI|nr:TRAP transporter small permease [Metabacillus arenae]MBD1379792.1 TRAP transporter small permease [Metabacillus arenae]
MVDDQDKQKEEVPAVWKYFNNISNLFALLTTVVVFIVVMIQIIGRLIGHSAPWTEEVTRLIFLWMVFLGIGIGFKEAESARVTVLVKYLPKKASIWIYSIGTIGFFLFMLYAGIELMQQQLLMNERSSVLLIPMWLIGISVPLSAVIGIINTIQSLIYHRNLLN